MPGWDLPPTVTQAIISHDSNPQSGVQTSAAEQTNSRPDQASSQSTAGGVDDSIWRSTGVGGTTQSPEQLPSAHTVDSMMQLDWHSRVVSHDDNAQSKAHPSAADQTDRRPVDGLPQPTAGAENSSFHTTANVGGQSQSSEALPCAHTLVSVRKLDWRDDVACLHPPFDVLLVADVVRLDSAHLFACFLDACSKYA